MKTSTAIIVITLVLAATFTSYYAGRISGLSDAPQSEINTTYAIQSRYNKIFKSVDTAIEQELTDYIIYNSDHNQVLIDSIINTRAYDHKLE